jgi:type VI secretion system protein ImpH
MDAMATPQRRLDTSVEAQFFSQPYEFDFHQAIRILEWLKPGCTPIGEGSHPKHEAVVFRSRVTLSAPSSDIYSLKRYYKYPDRPIMTVNFLGLGGIQGPLPTPYTETLIERLRQNDTAMSDFLDIFNHRLISFWHRVRKKIVIGIAQIAPEETSVGKCLFNLIGIDASINQESWPIPLRSLLKYTPLFWQRPHSLAGLITLLKGYFPYNITIKPFQGGWSRALPQDLSRLGTTGPYNRLGHDLILGCKSWHETQGILIHFHNLDWPDYNNFLEDQQGYKALRFLCGLYCEPTLKVHFQITINRKSIPPAYLGHGPRLGTTSFITRGFGSGFIHNPKVTVLPNFSDRFL